MLHRGVVQALLVPLLALCRLLVSRLDQLLLG